MSCNFYLGIVLDGICASCDWLSKETFRVFFFFFSIMAWILQNESYLSIIKVILKQGQNKLLSLQSQSLSKDSRQFTKEAKHLGFILAKTLILNMEE